MKKKLFSAAAFAAAAILLISALAACGSSPESNTGSSSAAEGVVTTVAEGNAAATAEASAESSSAKSSDSGSSEGSESAKAEKSEGSGLDGTYTFVELKSDGKDATEQVERLKSMGLPTDLVFDGDKADLMGSKYSVKDGKLVDADGELSFTVDGNRITVVDEESEMIFEKQ